jgi:DnaD/phage-associated family protein
MKKFPGFPEGSKLSPTAFPASFFSDLLPMIDDLGELKLTLFCFWALHQKQGRFRFLCRQDFDNEALIEGLKAAYTRMEAEKALEKALSKAIKRGTLLTVEVELNKTRQTLYFVNTALGRTAIAQIQAGAWQPGADGRLIEVLPERPNIYRLYEANIGMITPMIRDALVDAEKDYPLEWIVEAIRESSERNKRSWRYISSILKHWERDGRSREKAGQAGGRDGNWYVSGPYADFTER